MILFISYCFQGVNISKYMFLEAACHDSLYFLLFSGCKHLYKYVLLGAACHDSLHFLLFSGCKDL